MSNYGLVEIIKNVIWKIKSKFVSFNSRLIRFPIVIRGKKYIDFGNNLTTGQYCRLEAHGKPNKKIITFGNNVNIGYDVRLSSCDGITIGDNVLIGSRVLIIDNSHGNYSGEIQDSPQTSPNERRIFSKPVVIEKNVWIGENVVIQKGVTIGEGSIIGANSVVTKDIPEYSIAAGQPAKVIKKYNEGNKKWEKIK